MHRRQVLLAGLGAALLPQFACSGGQAATPPPPPSGFVDGFDVLDEDRWSTGEPHTLGRTDIQPGNVHVADGQLRLDLPGNELSGAELRTVSALSPGTSRARIRLANSPDSVTGFFLYSPPDFAREVDIELYNREAGRARLTTYSGGALTKTVEVELPFDPTADFHDYAITLYPGNVEFYADGNVLGAWSAGVPSEPMNLYLNAWYPAWLGGSPGSEDTAVLVDSVSFAPN